MFTRQFRTLVAVTSLSVVISAPGFTQDVNVEVGDERTEVQTDRQRVDVDVRRDRDGRRGRDSANRRNQQIAKWVMVDQNQIIDLAKFGLQRTKTPEVRELAETIVREHEQLAERLAGSADTNARPTRTRSADEVERDQQRRRENNREARRDRDGGRRPLENLGDRIEKGVERVAERTEQALENTRDAVRRELNDDDRPMNSSVAWVDVHRDIVNEAAKSAQRDLENEQGYQFDASFVGMLAAAHIQQEATLSVLSKRASGELAATLAEALLTIRQHKQHANRVMQTIKR